MKEITVYERWMIVGSVFISAFLFFLAVYCPPNNYDSMSYHMARVEHWMHNQNVSFYPTNIIRQLVYAPLAEYIILHFQVLTDGDYLANLIQWKSMILCAAAVSLLIARWGGTKFVQWLSIVFLLTIPMGILQSTTTQNDYAASFWLIVLVVSLMNLKEQQNAFWMIISGISLGLGLLTKGTIYIYSLPFLGGYLIFNSSNSFKKKIFNLLAIGFLAVTINSISYKRNIDFGGHPITPKGLTQVTNQSFGIKELSINIFRNLALHFMIHDEKWNESFLSLMLKVADPATDEEIVRNTTLKGYYFSTGDLIDEDFSGNFLHMILLIMTGAFVVINAKNLPFSVKRLLGGILLAFILYSILIQWQPWATRLHLPLFVLLSPGMAFVLFNVLKERLSFFIVCILFIYSLPWLFFNSQKAVIPQNGSSIFNMSRIDRYFINQRNTQKELELIAKHLEEAGCRSVGLDFEELSFEYPVWVVLGERFKDIRIEHVNVKQSLKYQYPMGEFKPCLTIKGLVD